MKTSLRPWCIHVLRWTLLAVILLAVRERHRQFLAVEQGRREVTASLAEVRRLLPAAASYGSGPTAQGGRPVLDRNGQPLGFVVQTGQVARSIIGYSGPNDLLLAFDGDGKLVGMRLLRSGDTTDHVALVRQSDVFPREFLGKTWDELAAITQVDGVSGATLTSRAIAEGIVLRVAGSRPSLRFPEPLTLAEALPLFPDAARLAAFAVTAAQWPSVHSGRWLRSGAGRGGGTARLADANLASH